MAQSNHERIGRALDLLRRGLGSFVEREFESAFKGQAKAEAMRLLGEDRLLGKKPIPEWDAAALLKLMWDSWNEVFRRTLGQTERTLVSELRDIRNRWAHQDNFSSDDAYRGLDSAARLLTAISAPEAQDVEKMKMELLRQRYDEQVRSEKRKSAGGVVESPAATTLRPWRDVVAPHKDVAGGRYQQAEFAADLWQVYLGEGTDEYRNPTEFFRRTFVTESLKRLLVAGVQRLSGTGGDPVVQLQTNFGGGKTHSMLALFHLCSGATPSELPGVDAILAEAGVSKIPKANRVVLVGNKISPGNPVTKPDGTVVRTLWGELAWQLGHAAGGPKEAQKAFIRIAADDENATSPGDVLRELFKKYGPCLVLVDEWVAYARQLHDQSDLPGGGFETQFSFAQALTESAKLAQNCLLVVSLPASDTATSPHAQADDVEVGGVRGREALDRLRNVVGRLESSWRPASAEEGFEIVRRRLFEPLISADQYKQRDLVAREFYDFYRMQKVEFPPECADTEYERRLKAAYPIHPEIFDRLYNDWSTLVKFQRTRGVLRLMAAVIHELWERGDKNPLILPSMMPIDAPRVQFELTRYLSDNWVPVLERDVDGPTSLPLRLDAEITNLGKLQACRRVARTIYLGSAPTGNAANKGIEDRRIKLGCVLPGESPAVFGDALRRLAGAATYLYEDKPRFWYSTQPTVTKLAEDRAEQLRRDPDQVAQEIERRVRSDVRKQGDFVRVHALPRSGADVPDDLEARLVVLGIDAPYSKEPGSPALQAAQSILDSRGTGPRLYKNTLVFLAIDKARLQDLDEAVRRFLAWDGIVDERETLNLDPHQVKQATTQRDTADSVVSARIPEAFQWLLVPQQTIGQNAIEWQSIRLAGQDALAARASKKLRGDELLRVAYAGTLLRIELDRVPLWRGEHVSVKQLVEDFARYLYLPRLRDAEVMVKAISEGLSLLSWDPETFALADAWDEGMKRYRGLKCGMLLTVTPDSQALLVKPEAARTQIHAGTPTPAKGYERPQVPGTTRTATGPRPPEPVVKQPPRRFHGTVTLNPARIGRDAGTIAEEVVQHLSGLVGANVEVTLEVQADVPEGIPDKVVRDVTENCKTLKFRSHGFEER